VSADPNALLGIDVFNIPETITKYLTYTLILHIVALAFAAASVVFGLLAHISTLSEMCFPTCFASLASTFSLIALIFDLVIFYIAKARIDVVKGASASIGVSVWLVLAAWLIAGLGGCTYGVGRCCMGRRQSREGGDPKGSNGYNEGGADDMRLQAIRDEQVRKKEQGLPSFQELERTPLTNAEEEDKYLYEDTQPMPGSLRRDGSVVQGVGVGYGRKNSRTPMNGQQGYGGPYGQQEGYGSYADLAPVPPARRPSAASGVTLAGNAGLGAGGEGVDRAQPQGYGGYYGNAQHNCECFPLALATQMTDSNLDYDQGYSDPYQQQQRQPYDYSAQQYDPQAQAQSQPQHQYGYPPQSRTPMPQPVPTPASRHVSGGYDPYSGAASSESHYNDPGPRISQSDPYGGYDDGLGAIGMAAASPVLDGPAHQRDYTGGTLGYPDQRQYPVQSAPLHVPTPQHLVTGNNSAANLLRSPLSPGSNVGAQRQDIIGSHGGGGRAGGEYDYDEEEEDDGMRPPSYGAVAGASGYQAPTNEKNRYR